jgi:protein tyrosine/serine phosphatase
MFHLRNNYVKIAVIAGLLLAFAAASLGKTHSDPAFSNIKIKNFGRMDERFYRGAQPKEEDYKALAALGIRTVIDLTDDPKSYEKPDVEALGMRYVNIAIPDKQDPSDAQVQSFLKLVNDPSTGKFYIHCAGGRHRTGVMGAVYRFNVNHWNFDQVYAEMKDYDFYTSWGHGGQKKFVEDYWSRIQSNLASTSSAAAAAATSNH